VKPATTKKFTDKFELGYSLYPLRFEKDVISRPKISDNSACAKFAYCFLHTNTSWNLQQNLYIQYTYFIHIRYFSMFPIRQCEYTRDKKKNNELKKIRWVSFEDVVYAITYRDIIDIFKNPLRKKYPNQRQIVVTIKGYPHVVPFVVDDEGICFFKTMYANRKYKCKLK